MQDIVDRASVFVWNRVVQLLEFLASFSLQFLQVLPLLASFPLQFLQVLPLLPADGIGAGMG